MPVRRRAAQCWPPPPSAQVQAKMMPVRRRAAQCWPPPPSEQATTTWRTPPLVTRTVSRRRRSGSCALLTATLPPRVQLPVLTRVQLPVLTRVMPTLGALWRRCAGGLAPRGLLGRHHAGVDGGAARAGSRGESGGRTGEGAVVYRTRIVWCWLILLQPSRCSCCSCATLIELFVDGKEDGLPGAGRLDVGGVHATPVGMVLGRMRKRDGAE
jgi:hypothetical protein